MGSGKGLSARQQISRLTTALKPCAQAVVGRLKNIYIEDFMANEKQHFDIIICGGGPAGSTCALALADSGLKVAVLEKNSFPRDKVCGDAVAAYVPNVLGTIHPRFKDALKTFDERVGVNTCRVVAPNEKFIDITYPVNGFISQRIAWDNFLYEQASAQINITYFLNHAVSDVTIDTDKGEVSVTAGDTLFTGKIVVGCDGAQSMVNKKITGTKVDLDHYAGAVRAYYKNVSAIPDNTFELHFIKGILPGYFWIFPLPDNKANVGLGVLSSVVSKRKMDLRGSMQKIIRETPRISDRFIKAELLGKIEGFGLPLGSRKVEMSGDNFMLCGDAASLIDPLSGEGIGQAMVSGRYAGWQARRCFEQNNFSAAFMKQYDKQVYAKFWRRHRNSYRIQQLIADRDWLFNGIFNVSLKSKVIKNLLVKAIG
jgi:geranylgeranyl reductase family protein